MLDFKATVFNSTQNRLGESPLWHPLLNTLFWVDIDKKTLFSKKVDNTSKKTLNTLSTNIKNIESQTLPIINQVTMPDTVTAIAWLDVDYLVLGTNTGIYRYHIISNTRELIIELESDLPHTRSNDGRADPWGGFWLSTMHVNAKKGQGKIYRYYKQQLECVVTRLTIPNGLCFDKSRLRAYYSDSLTSCVYMLHLHKQSGKVNGEATVFYQFKNTNIDPDGCVVDSEGNLWLAVWGMGCVICLSPDAKVIKTINVSTINPTCTAFGGKNANLLFVTSAVCSSNSDVSKKQGTVLQISDIKNGQFEPPVML